MAWIRLSDDYTDHPKFDSLSDGAFRLWHQAMGFCRKFQTDGVMPLATVRKFKAYSAKRLGELTTPWQPGEQPLWHAEGDTVTVHHYLQWNLSKEAETAERDAAAERMRRKRRVGDSPFGRSSPPRSGEQRGERSPDVLGREGNGSVQEKGSGEKPLGSLVDDGLAARAGALLRRYAVLYPIHRHGAKLRLVGSPLEFQDACSLCGVWDDPTLDKLAVIVLTTDDPFVSGTDRSFKIFAMKASWADDLLRAWEAEHGVSA